ncbi:hypothetical protein [Gracilibacillus alcaliphilus]|uniref:hypothetical protein n=1 Tax=Gracilibacillus alcaliphilus TaxID=1401441 RepID=UPI001959AC15|nr:hypothetical protein [Gracilibacillus alcaliphilus]MBM7675359.1 hypothetical protein [Gracilibacillus alcaliphilus]
MEKRKREIGIFLLIILIISTLFPPMETLHVQAEESELQQLQNLNQGEEIIFAGAEWIVLDPARGIFSVRNRLGEERLIQIGRTYLIPRIQVILLTI